MPQATNPQFVAALNNLFLQARKNVVGMWDDLALTVVHNVAFNNSAAVFAALPSGSTFSIADIIAALAQVLPIVNQFMSGSEWGAFIQIVLGILSAFIPGA